MRGMPTLTINEVVGRNVGSIREGAGLSLDAVARAAHVIGLRWNSARISRIERGEGNVTLDTLLILCALLSDMTSEKVSVARLVTHDGPINIAPNASLSPGVAQRLVHEGGLSFRATFEEGGTIIEEAVSSLGERYNAYSAILRPLLDKKIPVSSAINEGRAKWALSDERNARKLGITDAEFLAWSIRLWGRLMSLETEIRAPEGATAQKKGRITRELLDELRKNLESTHGDD